MKEEVNQDEQAHSECTSVRDALLARLNLIRSEFVEIQDQIHRTESEILQQQTQEEDFSQNHITLLEQLEKAKKDNESLVARRDGVEAELKAISLTAESMTNSVIEMQNQIEQQKVLREILQAKMDVSQKEIEQDSAALKTLERESDRTLSALDAVRAARKSAEQTKERIEKELQGEERSKAATEATVAQMQAEIATMRRNLDSRQAEAVRLREELEREKILLERGEDKWREEDTARREIAVQKALLDQAAGRARTELEGMQSSYQKTKGELDAVLEEIRRLTADNKKTEQEIRTRTDEKNTVSIYSLHFKIDNN